MNFLTKKVSLMWVILVPHIDVYSRTGLRLGIEEN